MRSFGKSQATGRRSVPRADAPLAAILSATTGNYFLRLADVSRTGARLVGERLPAMGEQLTLRTGKVKVTGEVVWHQTNACAIEFETPISPSEVARLRTLALLSDDRLRAG